ncbi:hypothetical protein R3W88_007793 [Solanum pinnatisectum]|uniref:Endonuclease/exonuclease/phosphatase domain-containing protein n=1 Tax=Solanum pinnatisectum TaxID=50273 RepID=A0AAV9M824_9SOLN|nr:hypothetical protein R3W88_007793 [Solanum pinnatisectum]
MIHNAVTHRGTGRQFWLTMVYGYNDQGLRRGLWMELEKISSQLSGPWAVMGDFNCVLNMEERLGRQVILAEVRDFRHCIRVCDLHDMKSSGAFVTWNNKQLGNDRVQSKIDRVLINSEWVTQMSAAEVYFMNEGLYDHCPAIIRWEQGSGGGRRPFQYFNMWSLASEFQTKVKESWQERSEGRHMFRVVGKLNRLRRVLKTLNKDQFSEIEKRAEIAMEQLGQCQGKIQLNPLNMDLYIEENKLAQEARILEKAKFQFLRQKQNAVA